ncbi:MAG TPA: rhodanese-like domain-containing protein [Planctomycetota bacterium]|jgi:rhodanese-related sulfurtransferase
MQYAKRCSIGLVAFLGAIAMGSEELYPHVTQEELMGWMKNKQVIVVDCNSSDSYQNGHIPGAISFSEAGNSLPAQLPADKSSLIVVYCGNEHCPKYKVCGNAIHNLGYSNVRHYAPGIRGWRASGARTVAGGEPGS